MPLSSAVDGSYVVVTLLSGGLSSLFHWAATQTSEREISTRAMRGELIASFGSGMVTAWILGAQTLIAVDPIGAFSVAAITGFAYGPTALILAAKKGSEKYGFSPPKDGEEKNTRP